jgi:hypothetical protein
MAGADHRVSLWASPSWDWDRKGLFSGYWTVARFSGLLATMSPGVLATMSPGVLATMSPGVLATMSPGVLATMSPCVQSLRMSPLCRAVLQQNREAVLG